MMRCLIVGAAILLASAARAREPSEMLDDPQLEARARARDHDIRCVVCQSEALASSNAEWAREARGIIRERILAGDSDAEVRAFFVERYGEFVLMTPPGTGSNLILWAAGPLMLLLAGGIAFVYLRGRESPESATDTGLSAEETKRLKEILKE